jgi:uncharacterized protein YfaS (alpha-2-macroglobulin family)
MNMSNKNMQIVLGGLAIFFVVLFSPLAFSAGPKLWLDKITFAPGESIKVHFNAPATYDSSAWIGIIPSNVPHGSETENDNNDIAYQHLNKKTVGILTFTAPKEQGNFDFRMNDSDNDGKEVASASFSVIAAPDKEGIAKLWLSKTTFKPGEKIVVNFTAPSKYEDHAWIGIVPSDIPHGKESDNDEHDVAYQYLNKKTSGFFTFTAPTEPGNYDFRMNDSDSNGNEVASVSFTIK